MASSRLSVCEISLEQILPASLANSNVIHFDYFSCRVICVFAWKMHNFCEINFQELLVDSLDKNSRYRI